MKKVTLTRTDDRETEHKILYVDNAYEETLGFGLSYLNILVEDGYELTYVFPMTHKASCFIEGNTWDSFKIEDAVQPCPTCNGTGASYITCEPCSGTGRWPRSQGTCPACNGEGRRIGIDDCATCKGRGIV